MRKIAAIFFLLLACAVGQAQILPYSGNRIGSHSLINTTGPGQELAFLNLIKGMGTLFVSGSYAFPGILDSNNFPGSSPSSTIAAQIPLTTSYSGNYVFGYTGTVGGTGIQVAVGSAITVISDPGSCVSGSTSFNLTVIGTNCVVTVNWGSSHAQVTLNFLASSTYSGFAAPYLVRSDQLFAYNTNVMAGQTWGGMNPDWVTKLQTLNPRVLRTMTWGGITVAGVVADAYNLYANRTPVTSLSFFANYWTPANWFGTGSGTNTYTINTGRTGPYVNGEIIHAQFTNANTVTTPTINDNSRGAVTMVSFAGQGLFSGSIPANELVTLQYDGVLDKFLMGHGGISPNVPLEVMVAACNSIPTDCWISIPWLDDSNSDITTIATYVANNLNPAHTAYFEWGNEVWNFSNNVSNWSIARGAVLGFPTSGCSTTQQIYDYYALRHSQVMALVTSAWASAGRTPTQLKRVMAWQAFGDSSSNGCTQQFRFNGGNLGNWLNAWAVGTTYAANAVVFGTNSLIYVSIGVGNVGNDPTTDGGVNWRNSGLTYTAGLNTAPNRPIDGTHTDIGSYATYYEGFHAPGSQTSYVSHGITPFNVLRGWADQYAAGGGSLLSAIYLFDADVQTSSGQDLSTLNATIYPAWNTMLATYGLPIISYEGDFEGTFPTSATCTTLGLSSGDNTTYCGASGRIQTMILGYQNSGNFYNTTQAQWSQYMAQSQSFAPAWFTLFPYDQWSAFSGDLYSTPFQSWNMMVNWNAR